MSNDSKTIDLGALKSMTTLSRNLHRQVLEGMTNWRDVAYYKEWISDPKKWARPRVSIDTFMDHPDFLNLKGKVYPKIRQMAREIIDGKFVEAVIVAGVGSGKTSLAEILACYLLHTLLCLRNPYETYDLMPDKPITIINMGSTATQALDVAFSGIKKLVEGSSWFMARNPRTLTGKIRFDSHNILLLSGNSKSETALGYNVFCGILDEAAFYMDNEHRQAAEEIYNALQRRIVSRFRMDGLMLMISSPKYEGDFIMRKLEEAKLTAKYVYYQQIPTWKCKPPKSVGKTNYFYFDSRKGVILDRLPPDMMDSLNRIEEPFNPHKQIWEIPEEHKKSFMQDPDKAKRDLGAIPSKTIQGYFPHKEIVAKMFEDRESPLQEDGSYRFAEPPLRTPYYIHIDLALNKNGKGDFAGLAMAHFAGWEIDEITGEKRKKIVLDLVEQIGASPLTKEIDLEEVRNKIYALKEMGFFIKLITLDRFASADFFQILKRKGFRAEYLSVDRTVEPYQMFKEFIYAGNVRCHKMPILETELLGLEITKGSKIDHAPGMHKDCADGACGAVYNAQKESGLGLGISSGEFKIDAKGNAISNSVRPEMTYYMNSQDAHSAKESYYKELQEFANKGWIG